MSKNLSKKEIKAITDMADKTYDATQAIEFAEWVSINHWYWCSIARWHNKASGAEISSSELYDKWHASYYSIQTG